MKYDVTRLLAHKSQDEIKLLLNFFLTHKEQQTIAERVAVIQLLLEDELSQRDIAAKQQISIAKITRGSNMLKTLNSALLAKLTALLAR